MLRKPHQYGVLKTKKARYLLDESTVKATYSTNKT